MQAFRRTYLEKFDITTSKVEKETAKEAKITKNYDLFRLSSCKEDTQVIPMRE